MTDRTAVAVVNEDDYSEENVALIKKTYAPDLTMDEFKLVIAEGKHRGLSALNKEIFGLKFQGKLTTMVSLAGARKLAHQSGKLCGIEGPFWMGPDRKWQEVWIEADPPIAAKFIVWIEGYKVPVIGIAIWKERARTYYKDGKTLLMPTWAQMPALMLGKVAETDAYKRAGLIADTEQVSYDDDEPNTPHRAVFVRERAKESAMKHVHQIGHEQGVDHEGVRGVVKAIKPGVESLNDEAVTARDLNAAADAIDAFGRDAAETIVAEPEFSLDADAAPSERDLWRDQVQASYEHWDRATASAISAALKEDTDKTWRYLDLIQYAPTVILRDKMVDAARRAGLSDAEVEAANARRKDGAQIRRAAEALANPIVEAEGRLLPDEPNEAAPDYSHLTR